MTVAVEYVSVGVAIGYAEDVVAGRIVACKWARLACKRFLTDLDRQGTEAFPYWLDEELADRPVAFFDVLRHIKGSKRGQLIVLEPWQVFLLVNIFGWVDEHGLRRFSTVYLEVARKNAKSTLAAGIALYLLVMDGEGGAEVYSAATKRDQAKIVWDIAKAMVNKSPELKRRVNVFTGNLSVAETDSKFEPLAADTKGLDGLNVHAAIIDELHAHKTREVYDVLDTATGAREQPIILNITTAGVNLEGVCYEQHTYVRKILDQVVEDESYFGIIYTLDLPGPGEADVEGKQWDDWNDPACWIKANPNLGVSVFEKALKAKLKQAQQSPAKQNAFKTKRLNIWCSAGVAWMPMEAWNAGADPTLSLDDFVGEPCYMAHDLASKVDVACMAILFVRELEPKDHYYLFVRHYMPKDRINENAGGADAHFAGWAKQGLVILTEGNVIDFDVIEDDTVAQAKVTPPNKVGHDPWQATQFATHLFNEYQIPMEEVRQGARTLSEPMKELQALALSGRLHHNGDPVLAWMVSNVVSKSDANDNIRPDKERVENKIDGAVAAIMALALALADDEDTEGSIYNRMSL